MGKQFNQIFLSLSILMVILLVGDCGNNNSGQVGSQGQAGVAFHFIAKFTNSTFSPQTTFPCAQTVTCSMKAQQMGQVDQSFSVSIPNLNCGQDASGNTSLVNGTTSQSLTQSLSGSCSQPFAIGGSCTDPDGNSFVGTAVFSKDNCNQGTPVLMTLERSTSFSDIISGLSSFVLSFCGQNATGFCDCVVSTCLASASFIGLNTDDCSFVTSPVGCASCNNKICEEDHATCPQDCPSLCGNKALDTGEECDASAGSPPPTGSKCAANLCVGAGETGPLGKTECTCLPDCGDNPICSSDQDCFSEGFGPCVSNCCTVSECPGFTGGLCPNCTVDPGEECDTGEGFPFQQGGCPNNPDNPTNNPDDHFICIPDQCKCSLCGNFVRDDNVGEQCDTGTFINSSTDCDKLGSNLICNHNCQCSLCGNALNDPGEDCDTNTNPFTWKVNCIILGQGCSADTCTCEPIP